MKNVTMAMIRKAPVVNGWSILDDGGRVSVADDVCIGENVEIRNGVNIGPRTHIGHNVLLDNCVNIAGDVHIDDNVIIHEATNIDPYSIIHNNVFIGTYCNLGGVVIQPNSFIGNRVNTYRNDRDASQCVFIGKRTNVDNDVSIGYNVSIGEGGQIADYVTIGPDTSIERNVVIGRNSHIGGHSRLYDYVKLGRFAAIDDNVCIRRNTEIGNNFVARPMVEISNDCVVHDNVTLGNLAYLEPLVLVQKDVTIGESASVGIGTRVDQNACICDNVVVPPHWVVSSGAKLKRSPICILGTKEPIGYTGCHNYVYMDGKYFPLNQGVFAQYMYDNDYTDKETKEYELHFKYVCEWIKLNKD